MFSNYDPFVFQVWSLSEEKRPRSEPVITPCSRIPSGVMSINGSSYIGLDQSDHNPLTVPWASLKVKGKKSQEVKRQLG